MMALLKFPRILLPVVLLAVWGCNKPDKTEQRVLTGEALGTSYQIAYFRDTPSDISSSVDSIFSAINQSMSTYLPNSDISKINRGDSTLVVDHMFREVFTLSAQIHKRTKGYFDPTVGVLTDAWGFGPGEAIALDSIAVDSLLRYVGLAKVTLTGDSRIRKAHPEIRIDFNAIAKGYAIDRIAMLLENRGVDNYLVEVGGEVRTGGVNIKKDTLWTVGVDDPTAGEERRIMAVVALEDRAMASSGNYRKFRVDSVSGAKYVHTIDPKTGYTKSSNVLAATVMAPTCAEADAYATAFMALPLEETKRLLGELTNLEGMIIYTDKNGKIAVFETPGFTAVRLR